nr:hypothetical protein [Brucella intermedia]
MNSYDISRNQVVCDVCGNVQLRGLHFRKDFDDPVRLCTPCMKKHDGHPEVKAEREHYYNERAMGDDF